MPTAPTSSGGLLDLKVTKSLQGRTSYRDNRDPFNFTLKWGICEYWSCPQTFLPVGRMSTEVNMLPAGRHIIGSRFGRDRAGGGQLPVQCTYMQYSLITIDLTKDATSAPNIRNLPCFALETAPHEEGYSLTDAELVMVSKVPLACIPGSGA